MGKSVLIRSSEIIDALNKQMNDRNASKPVRLIAFLQPEGTSTIVAYELLLNGKIEQVSVGMDGEWERIFENDRLIWRADQAISLHLIFEPPTHVSAAKIWEAEEGELRIPNEEIKRLLNLVRAEIPSDENARSLLFRIVSSILPLGPGEVRFVDCEVIRKIAKEISLFFSSQKRIVGGEEAGRAL